VKVVDAEDEVQFLPVELISDTPDGMWLSGLPEVVNLITMGHEFVAVGQRVISVPTSP
jgi:multidrug efflux system membrane fusion protein